MEKMFQGKPAFDSRNADGTVFLYFILLIHFVILIPLACDAVNFLSSDYLRYTWSELMINYEGGFVRRGLMGQLLLFLSHHVSVSPLIPLLFFVVYILFSYCFLRYLHTRLNLLAVLLTAISPGLLLFPVYDVEAFGRKDIIVLGCFLIVTKLCVSSALKKNRTLVPTIIFFSVYFTAFLIHEIVVFFFPLAFLLLLYFHSVHGKANRCLLCGTMFFIFMSFLSVLFSSLHSIEEMTSSWKHVVDIPSTSHINAMHFLLLNFDQGLQYVLIRLKNPVTLFSTVMAFLLSFIPVFIAMKTDNFLNSFKNVISTISCQTPFPQFFKIILFLSVLSPFFIFFLAADGGRVIYLLGIIYLCFLSSIIECGDGDPTSNSRAGCRCPELKRFLFITMCYAASWNVVHFVAPGGSLLKVSTALSQIGKLLFR